MKKMTMGKAAKVLSMTALAAGISMANAADTIKVGVLHSLSGTMAISETTLKDTVLMMVEEQNEKGGLLGKKLEAVVVDPASNWPLFAEKARELLEKEKVDVIFGCWTSVSRKSVLPVIEELNGLMFYPVQYEGEESSLQVRLQNFVGGTWVHIVSTCQNPTLSADIVHQVINGRDRLLVRRRTGVEHVVRRLFTFIHPIRSQRLADHRI